MDNFNIINNLMNEMISTVVKNETVDSDSSEQKQKKREKVKIFSNPTSALPTKLLNNSLEVTEIRHSKSDHLMPESSNWNYKTEKESLFCSGRQLCTELDLRNDNDNILKSSNESLITENISVTCKESNVLNDIRGNGAFDFVSNQSEKTESTIKLNESINSKMERMSLTKDNLEAMKCIKGVKVLTSKNESSLIKNMENLEKGDNKGQIFQKYNEKILLFPNKTIRCEKNVEELKEVEKSLSCSSLNKKITQKHESIFKRKENFQTNSHYIDNMFQAALNSEYISSMGIYACYSSERSKKQSNTENTCSKIFNKSIFRSNKVSPTEMKSEVNSKSKVRQFVSNFIKGLRKSFKNLKQSCRSKRNRNSLVFCSLPMYLYI